jgi:hypothetical protein
MSPEDIKKLLGGYATDTLTTEERQALFAAALEDQELFDALAREQSLRDLLRDPAARAELAELLSALDSPATRPVGVWQWLRRPMVAGLATAGVAAIAIVAVWQGTRLASVRHQAQPVMVAELKRPELSSGTPAAQPPAPASQRAIDTRAKDAAASDTLLADKDLAPVVALPSGRLEAESRAKLMKQKETAIGPSPGRPAEESMRDKMAESAAAVRADKKTALASPQPLRQFEAGERANIAPAPAGQMADNKAVAAVAPPPPPPAVPAAMPVVVERKAEADAASPRPAGGTISGAVQANPFLDARALFYVDQAAPAGNALVQPSGGGGAPPPTFRTAPRKDAPTPMAKGATGLIAPITATAQRLGLRVSILRGQSEVDLTTVLDPGEKIRLKLVPNADGYLYVAQETRTVARGRAQRLQPFVTPVLRYRRSGQKEVTVLLSRRPRTVAPLPPDGPARDDLVWSSAGQEHATYVVAGPRQAGAQEVVVPVTLTYR